MRILGAFVGMINPKPGCPLPVLLGIHGSRRTCGRADGYGYSNSNCSPLNWLVGRANAWYALPTIDASPYLFNWWTLASITSTRTGLARSSAAGAGPDFPAVTNAMVTATARRLTPRPLTARDLRPRQDPLRTSYSILFPRQLQPGHTNLATGPFGSFCHERQPVGGPEDEYADNVMDTFVGAMASTAR